MPALVLIAHGSRRAASNEEVRKVSEQLRVEGADRYAPVVCAFLELAEPTIPQGIEYCVTAGSREIVILPYFLSAGRHVSEDIPRMITQAQQHYPDVMLRLAPHLGNSGDLVPALLKLAMI